MEALIQALQSGDMKTRLAAAEQFYNKLRQKSSIDTLQFDAKNIVVSNCLALSEETNLKLCLIGLDCLQTLIENQTESFQPYLDMTFDLLIDKFADIQPNVSTRATEVMVSIINVLGLTEGFEKLTPFFSHKIFLVREQVLYTVLKLQNLYGDDIMVMPDVCANVGTLLMDSRTSVKNLAITCLVSLYDVFGELMLEELMQNSDIKASQIQAVKDAISYKNTHGDTLYLPADNQNQNQNQNQNGHNGNFTVNDTVNHAKYGQDSSLGDASKVKDDVREDASTASAELASLQSNGSNIPVPGSSRPSLAGMSRTRDLSAPKRNPSNRLALTSAQNIQIINQNQIQVPEGNSSPRGCKNGNAFHPSFYMGLLGEGSVPKGTKAYSEKDLGSSMESIIKGLNNVEDWNVRITSLQGLQSLAVGDGGEFESFAGHLKANHELIGAQISDLRSVVCKEACRTTALLARRLGPLFSPLAELWLPVLFKLLGLKIQVMSSAADRCVRIILTSCPNGYPKILPVLQEHSSNKIPVVRKCVVEYFSLVAALWKSDMFIRILPGVKKMMTSSIADSDPNVRRAARQLFWVLRGKNAQWQGIMDGILSEMEATAQKHIVAESQKPSDDLQELLSILARPPNFSQYDPYSPSYVPTPSDLILLDKDKDRENVPMKKIIPSFAQLSGTQPLPPPPPGTGTGQGPLGSTRSPSAKRGLTPGIAGKSLSMSSIPSDRDIGNGMINGNGHDHNGYHTGTANGMSHFNNNGNCINSTKDDGNHTDHNRSGGGIGGGGGGSRVPHAGLTSSERYTPDDSVGNGNGNGNAGSKDLSRLLSPPQGASIRPFFSRLNGAGQAHNTGDREGEDTDHYSNATGLTGSGGGGTAGGIGTGTLTGAGGAARRVAPSVLGASRRSSLSAPLRVLPRPPKDEEGYEEGSAVKRSAMTLGGTSRRGSIGGMDLGPNVPPIPPSQHHLSRTASASRIRPGGLSTSGTGWGDGRDGMRESFSGAPSRLINGSASASTGGPSTRSQSQSRGSMTGSGTALGSAAFQTFSPNATSSSGFNSGTGSGSTLSSRPSASAGVCPPSPTTALKRLNRTFNQSSLSFRDGQTLPGDATGYSNGLGGTGGGGTGAGAGGGTGTGLGGGAGQQAVTVEYIKGLCEDTHWATRLRGFELISEKLSKVMSVKADVGHIEDLGSKDSNTVTTAQVESYVDFAVTHLGDAHQKVAVEAMTVLSVCVQAFTVQTVGKLGALLTALFNRLADRRAQIKDQANILLNATRAVYEPNAIMGALSPRILEIPERMKTALMQYMGAVLPSCSLFFSSSQNTASFLVRMANIMGCSGSKPSVTLSVAGRRILDLLAKAAPQVLMSQLSALPLQQQIVLKKVLAPSIPDIDHQVALAGRNDWSRSTGEREKEKPKTLQRADSFAASKRLQDNIECSAEPSLGTLTIDSEESSRSVKENNYLGMVETTHTPHTAPGTHSVGASPLRTLSSSSSSSSPYGVERADAPRELHGIKSPSLAVSTTPYYGSRTPSSFSPSAMSASTPLNPGTSPFRLRTPSTPYNSNNNSNSNGITINGNSSSSSGSNGADTGTGIAMSSPGIAHSDSGKPAMYESPLSRPSSAFSLSLGSPSFHSATPTLTLSHGLTNGQGQAQGQGQGQGHTRESLKVDTERILTGLGLKSSSADKTVAARELRHLVRTADDTYWAEYCPQIIAKLLEVFDQKNFFLGTNGDALDENPGHVSYYSKNSLTGFTPSNHNPLLKTRQLSFPSSPSPSSAPSSSSSSSFTSPTAATTATFFSSRGMSDGGTLEGTPVTGTGFGLGLGLGATTVKSPAVAQAESMQISCTVLLLLVRHRGCHVMRNLSLLVSQLCSAAAHTPSAVTLHCEQVLCDVSRFDPPRFIQAVLPYTATAGNEDNDSSVDVTAPTPAPSSAPTLPNGSTGSTGDKSAVRLMAVRVVAEAIKHMPVLSLLDDLPSIVTSIVPSMTSSVVDVRKAVIVVLVNAFFVIGDALYPFVEHLPESQKKLLNIYIDKQLQKL